MGKRKRERAQYEREYSHEQYDMLRSPSVSQRIPIGERPIVISHKWSLPLS